MALQHHWHIVESYRHWFGEKPANPGALSEENYLVMEEIVYTTPSRSVAQAYRDDWYANQRASELKGVVKPADTKHWSIHFCVAPQCEEEGWS